jgi:hypothetical protein
MTDPRLPARPILAAILGRVTVPGLRATADVAGLASLVAAAWLWHAGWAALGVALLVLAARGGER